MSSHELRTAGGGTIAIDRPSPVRRAHQDSANDATAAGLKKMRERDRVAFENGTTDSQWQAKMREASEAAYHGRESAPGESAEMPTTGRGAPPAFTDPARLIASYSAQRFAAS